VSRAQAVYGKRIPRAHAVDDNTQFMTRNSAPTFTERSINISIAAKIKKTQIKDF
jgi:hypothetical protein